MLPYADIRSRCRPHLANTCADSGHRYIFLRNDQLKIISGYYVNDNVRITRMPNPQLRRLVEEPYEFSSSPRADESEWDQFTKFLLRKVERFVKATAIEVRVPEEFTEEGRYSPRFVDEIADELDIIEDKKASVLSKL